MEEEEPKIEEIAVRKKASHVASSIYARESQVSHNREAEILSEDEDLLGPSDRKSADYLKERKKQKLSKRFVETPSPLKVGRVLAFLSSELGFASAETDVHRLKNFGWPQTESEWEEADAIYCQHKPPILPMTLKYQLKSVKAAAQANIRRRLEQEKGNTAKRVTTIDPQVKFNFLPFAEVTALVMGRLHQHGPETGRAGRVTHKYSVNSRASIDSILSPQPSAISRTTLGAASGSIGISKKPKRFSSV